MTQANTQILVTPGTGETLAYHTINGKKHVLSVQANGEGHILGTIPTYSAFSGSIAAAANKPYLHVFNATGSGVVVKVRKVFIQPVVVANALATQTWSVRKTSAVGTTGNTAITIQKHDTTSAAVPAQVTAAHSFTAGGTDALTWFDVYVDPEETRAGVYLQPWYNILPTDGEFVQDYVIREGEGFKVINVTGGTLNYSVVGVFSIE